MALIGLDRQHTGKPGKWRDLGAACPRLSSHEAFMTAEYLLSAERWLRRLGHDVVPLSDGTYKERHARFNAYADRYMGPSCYIAAHLNAGGGDYGAAFYDSRSSLGERLAVRLQTQFHDDLPDIGKFKIIKARPGDWTGNAFNTISGVWSGPACGICFEPVFLDNSWHISLLKKDALSSIGRALAHAVDAWAESL